jgi:hypothetical protein
MRTAWETLPIEFTGGLKTNISLLQQGTNFPGSASILINFEPSIEGGYKKIEGYNRWIDSVVPGTDVVRGVVVATKDNVVAVRNAKYYTCVGKTSWVEKYNIGDELGSRIRHTTFNFDGTPRVCMVDSFHKPVYYNTVADTITIDAAAPADVQGASQVVVFKNRLFFAKGPNIVYTAPYAHLDYNPANGAGVVNVGDTISGLIVFRDQLIVFCTDQIKRLTGSSPSDFALLDITKRTGAVNGDTIQEVGGDILYLGPDGIRYLSATEKNDDFGLQRASEDIQKDVLDTFSGVDSYASMVIRPKAQYRLFRYNESTPAESSRGILGVRFADQSSTGIEWAILKGMKVYVTDSKQFGNNEICLFANSTGYVYEMEQASSFDGASISCVFKTPFLPLGDPQLRKTIYKHTLYLKSNGRLELNFRMYLDYEVAEAIQPTSFLIEDENQGVTTYGTGIYGEDTYGGISRVVYKNQVVGSGFTVALSYSESSTRPAFSLDTAVLEYRTNDRK